MKFCGTASRILPRRPGNFKVNSKPVESEDFIMKKMQMWCQYYESNQNNAEGNTELADIGRSNSLKLFI